MGLRFLNVISLQIDELPPVMREDVEDFLDAHPRSPAAQLRPKFGMVGNVWGLPIWGLSCNKAPVVWGRHRVTRWKILICASWNR